MPSLQLYYDQPGWAYYRRCEALKKYAPPGWDIALSGDPLPQTFPTAHRDVHLLLPWSYVERLRNHDPESIIVAGVNVGWLDGDIRHRQHFGRAQQFCDHLVINNRAAWALAGELPGTSWISNGVDRDVFQVTRPLNERPPTVIWLGSRFHSQAYRDTKRYHAILVPLAERLGADGITCEWRQVESIEKRREGGFVTPAELAEWYNGARVYVNAAASEGTPNPMLEAAACGCAVVTTCTGNAPELIQHGVNGLLADGTLEAVEAAVRYAVEDSQHRRLALNMQRTIRWWGWEQRAGEYFALFRRLLENGGKA